MVTVSRDVDAIGISAIKEMAMRAAAIPDAVSLSWGLPSFRTPAPIRDAVADALAADPDVGKYSLPDGLPAFRSEIAAQASVQAGRTIDPDREVVATAGNMEAVVVLLRTLIDPGDEIIVTDPCFASHLLQIRLCHGRAVFWPLDEGNGWVPDPTTLAGRITPRTKAILLVNPINPTGTLLPEDLLAEIGRVAARHGLLVIVDDPYSFFVYDTTPRHPLAIPELAGELAYLFTFSKCYAMSGFRAGYMILPDALKRQVLKVHDATLICAPRVSQIAALAALRAPDLPSPAFRSELDARRTRIMARLDRLPALFDYVAPAGAYYIFPRLRSADSDSRAFALRLLNEAHVAVTPGAAFGPSGEGHVRMAYCVDAATIDTAFDRIEAFAARV